MKLPAARVEALVWVLIYGGMGTMALGLGLWRDGAHFGWGVVTVGSALLVAGSLLVWIRSRMSGGR